MVNLKKNLVVDKEPIPSALGVRIERLYNGIATHEALIEMLVDPH